MLQNVRSRGKTLPVLVLTGRSERDVVMCLKAGADDYMRKPFQFDELLARVETRLRSTGTAEPNVLSAGRDPARPARRARATVDERPVELTARELALLETFLRNAGQVLSRGKLLSDRVGLLVRLRRPTSSTSTSTPCARSSATMPSRPCAGPATG